MFEKHQAKKAAKIYQEALTGWQTERDACTEEFEAAQNFAGVDSQELMLGPGEALFLLISNVALIEERRGAGHYAGRSSGFSLPAGTLGGRAVRYRVGASRGQYVQGTPAPTPIDTGTVYVTNKRVVFRGTAQTRECKFERLLGFEHSGHGFTTFSVTNRQKPTTIHYGSEASRTFAFRLALALAHFHGTVGELGEQKREELARIDAARPVAPPTAAAA